LGAAQQTKRQ